MRLRAIRARDVGPFRNGLAVEGLTGALDVLVAPNEAGKSTLFRAIALLFFEKHSTTSKAILALPSEPGGSALLEADFEAAGALWRITKSFGRTKRARLVRLTSGGGAVAGEDYAGLQAESKLATLAGVGDSGRGPLGFLWVGQGEGLDMAAVAPKPDEAVLLKDIVEREVAALTGAGRLRVLGAAVADELRALQRDRDGRPRTGGAWDLAIRRRDQIAEAIAAATARREANDRRRVSIEELRARHDAITAPADVSATGLPAVRAAHARLVEICAAVALADRRHDAAVARRAEAERLRQEAEASLNRHVRLLARRADLEADVAALTVALGEARERHEQLGTALLSHDRRIDDLETQSRNLEALQSDAARIAGQMAAAEAAARQVAALRPRLEEAQTLEADCIRLETEIAATAVTEHRLKLLTEAAREQQRASDRLMTALPSVSIDYEPGAEGRILVGSQPAPPGPVAPEKADGWPLRLVVPGIGAIVVDAGQSADRAGLSARADAATNRLGAELAACGATSLDEAIAEAARKATLQRDLTRSRARLEGLAPDGVDQLMETCERLVEAAAAADTDANVAGAASCSVDADLARVKNQLAAETAERAAFRRSRDEAALAIAGTTARLDAARAGLSMVEQDIASLPDPASGHDARLVDDLRGRLDVAAKFANEAVREEVALREAVIPTDERAAYLATRDRLAEQAERLELDVRDLSLKLERLYGELAGADDGAVPVDLGALCGELEAAEAAVARHEDEIAGLRLLSSTLDEAAEEARARFLEPVLRRLAPYLALVLPGAGLELDGGMGVAALTRGETMLPVAALSGGTREQIAVLVRLAYAQILAETGRPVPVILDDALVYSDDARLGAMFKALEAAAIRHQVLVLSCQEQRFANLAGRRATLVPWRPVEAAA